MRTELRQGQKDRDSYVLDVPLGKDKIAFLVDTGAEICLIKDTCLTRLKEINKERYILHRTDIVIKGVNSSKLYPLGFCNINFTLDRQNYVVKCYVVRAQDMNVTATTDALLGMDFLRNVNWSLNFTGKLVLGSDNPQRPPTAVNLRLARIGTGSGYDANFRHDLPPTNIQSPTLTYAQVTAGTNSSQVSPPAVTKHRTQFISAVRAPKHGTPVLEDHA